MSRRPIAVSCALVALTFAVYHPVAGHDFVDYDDPIYILDNPNLEGGLRSDAVLGAFTRPYETNWIPLTWISLQIDHALYAEAPAGYLLTNVAMHALSAVLLFAALLGMTGTLGASAFVAAVFAVHPLHVESVAWASERKDALSGVFFMLGLLAWKRYARHPSAPSMASVALCLGLGLLAKPMLVTFPFALLLLDFWPLGRLGGTPAAPRLEAVRVRRALLEKWPLFALVTASSVVTYLVQRDSGAMSADGMLPLAFRIANALQSWLIYLRQSVWPSGLAVFYPHPLGTLATLSAAACGLALAGITAACLRLATTRPHLAVGWLWYLGTLVPVIGLVQVGMQARADRYMYLPLIGVSIALAWEVVRQVGASPLRRGIAAAAGLLALVILAVATWFQVGTWRDTRTLFAHATAVTERNFVAHHSLGIALLLEQRLDEAEPHLVEALRLKPRWSAAHSGMGDLLLRRDEYAGASEAYRRALALEPRLPTVRANLGRALARSGRSDEAIAEYRRALRQPDGPGAGEIHALLANALMNRDELAQAVDHYQQALALAPDLVEAQANLGFALLRLGRIASARAAFFTALAKGAEPAELELGLAELERRSGDGAAAIVHYRSALSADPHLVAAANNLAWILATHPDASLRAPDEAIQIAAAAAAQQGAPDPALLDTLAASYAAAGRFPEAVEAASRALQLCLARRDVALAAEVRSRLALYGAGRPYVGRAPSEEGHAR